MSALSLKGEQKHKNTGLGLAVWDSAYASLLVEFYTLFRITTSD